MALGQTLQGLERTHHFQEIGLRIHPLIVLGYIDDDKIVNATAIKLGNVVVAVVALRVERKEERLFGKAE